MKTLIILCLLSLAARLTFAQVADSLKKGKSNLYGEFGGAGFLSGNYEHLFFTKSRVTFAGRIGIGLYPVKLGLYGGESEITGIIPITFSVLYGRKFSLELGTGVTMGFDESNDFQTGNGPLKWFNGILGVRYQKPSGGFFARLAYTPWIWYPPACVDPNCLDTEPTIDIQSVVGVSLGGRLPKKQRRGR